MTGWLVVAVFALTYAGMAAGRVPGFGLDRAGLALVAVAILLAAGAADTAALTGAIDAPTLLILFGLMLLSGQFAVSGFYDACALRIASARRSPLALLALTVGVSGGLSALLANDIVVYAMTPLLCQGIAARGLDPRPYLIALAASANAGSAATIIGNPQNIVIGQAGDLAFWPFVAVCGPPALAAMGLVLVVVGWQWRGRMVVEAPVTVPAVAAGVSLSALDRPAVAKGLAGMVALLALFAAPVPHEAGVLAIAAAMLTSRRRRSRDLLGSVDWGLLVLFACLFALNGAFAATGLPARALAGLAESGLLPDRLSVLAPLSLLASNTIGNVPTVVMLLSVWPDPPAGALTALALLSTLAGNLLLVGSLANLIVAERAAQVGVRLGFMDHARAGVPITIASLVLAGGWLYIWGIINW
ncbi:MAG TPA: SLC13 family permease [Azospirillaceae bacterium]|nr:SLC13 family permease [Azospirillaceae bacterium]